MMDLSALNFICQWGHYKQQIDFQYLQYKSNYIRRIVIDSLVVKVVGAVLVVHI